jgi:hypothetical protein
VDTGERPGKTLGAVVHAVNVPNEVRVSFNPYGQVVDDDALFSAVGRGQLFALSRQSDLESAYLLDGVASETMAEIVRSVLEEPIWMAANAQGGDPDALRTFRAFRSLYTARTLAAQARFEIEAYRGAPDPEKVFRDAVEAATGVQLSATDGKMALGTMGNLRSTARFQGMLLAAAVRRHLREQFGAAWFTEGKAGGVLQGLYGQGGLLRASNISQACGGVAASAEAWKANFDLLLGSAVGGQE